MILLSRDTRLLADGTDEGELLVAAAEILGGKLVDTLVDKQPTGLLIINENDPALVVDVEATPELENGWLLDAPATDNCCEDISRDAVVDEDVLEPELESALNTRLPDCMLRT
jgi:hypothetical protein